MPNIINSIYLKKSLINMSSSSVRLIIDCPCSNADCDCDKRNISWRHFGCGGYQRIFDDGNIICEKCQKKLYNLIDSSWSCSKCFSHGEFTKKDKVYQLIRVYSSLDANDEFKKKLLGNICEMIVKL